MDSKWSVPASITTLALAAAAALSVSTAISLYFCRKKSKALESKVQDLEISLNSSLQKCGAERQGRIRAQQSLRKALAQPKSENLEHTSYPMIPIGVVQSCFSTRNGTPRQPLLVPLARACLVLDSARVPAASLEGLAEYSHCWIIYVFHLNTDLEKLWKQTSRSKFKAKVRVPRLKGGRIGVFATRSPHRPCPIGLTVARVEAVQGNTILLSGVDLVNGTPILDIKPYLPYCDKVQEAVVPKWVMEDNMLAVASITFSEEFYTSLAKCWETVGKKSLYASPNEFQCLIEQVLSWDIRSVSQRNQPHGALIRTKNGEASWDALESGYSQNDKNLLPLAEVTYHVMLERVDVSYKIDSNSNVLVERVATSSGIPNVSQIHSSYLMQADSLR